MYRLFNEIVELLGQLVSVGEATVNLDRNKSICAAPRPERCTTLRVFLGLAGYYRGYAQGLADISATLYPTTSKYVSLN